MLMTYTERGVYITLLSACWLEGSIPSDTKALAAMLKLSAGQVERMWAGPLGQCFHRCDDGRLRQKRLEREREAQARYREKQSLKGRASAEARFNRGSTVVQPSVVQPDGNSSSSSSSSSSKRTEERTPLLNDARSRRPIFSGQRLTVFEWMFEDCRRTLGENINDFGLDEWFFELDTMAVRSNLVIPKRDGGEWLQAQLVAEAQRRGIPLRFATGKPAMGKQATNLAAALANIKREAV